MAAYRLSLIHIYAKDIVDRMKKRVIAIEKGKIIRDEEGVYGFKEGVNTLE